MSLSQNAITWITSFYRDSSCFLTEKWEVPIYKNTCVHYYQQGVDLVKRNNYSVIMNSTCTATFPILGAPSLKISPLDEYNLKSPIQSWFTEVEQTFIEREKIRAYRLRLLMQENVCKNNSLKHLPIVLGGTLKNEEFTSPEMILIKKRIFKSQYLEGK